ncbi:MAG TPA: hypothetical protein VF168_05520 [Trueperaceae bacterium]
MAVRAFRLLTLLGLAILIAACSSRQTSNLRLPYVTLDEVIATSATSLKLTFDGALGPAALDPGHFALSSPSAGPLEVLGAYLAEGGSIVYLSTAPQAPDARYQLELVDLRDSDGQLVRVRAEPQGQSFVGTTVTAPVLESAAPLSSTEVLLIFTNPDGYRPVELPESVDPARVRFDPALDVVSVEMIAPNYLIITTEPQEVRDYQAEAGGVFDMVGRLVDPQRSVARFTGLSALDETPPVVVSAKPLTDQTVRVDFSEPVDEAAAEIDNYRIRGADGDVLILHDVTLNRPFNTSVLLTTRQQLAGEPYTLQVSGVGDRDGNAMTEAGGRFEFTGVGRVTEDPPRVVAAGATGNTTVLVTFNKPVARFGAETPANYRITALDSGGSLSVDLAQLVTGTTVQLTTGRQSAIRYQVEVVNVRDEEGTPLEAPSILRPYPNRAQFTGIAPSGGDLVDSDEDGLSDAEEERGWSVNILLPRGIVETRTVTSDPYEGDSDLDGIGDATEKAYRIDPRDGDSEDDGLSDFEELNFIYSDPTIQDSDDDGLIDGLEVDFFRTSPVTADTDGDQFSDGEEVVLPSRSPVLADLPRVSIEVGDVHLTLDERYSYTDTEGNSQTVETSSSTTLEQGTQRTYGTSDTSTLGSSLTFGQSLTVSGTYEFPGGSVGAEATTNSEQSSSDEYTSTVSEESAVSSNETYNESVARGSTFETSSSVVREVEGAAMQLALNLGSVSDVPFSVTNLEITAMWQDPIEPTRLVPVASLVPEVQLDTGEAPQYNLGPFVPDIGPLVFANRSVFPKTLEELMRSPRGLVFKVANYDIEDEEGRNFAFSSLDTYDRTAGITIDYGDGSVGRYRIAANVTRLAPFADTNGNGEIDLWCGLPEGDSCDNDGDGAVTDRDRITFDERGRVVGRTMEDALALLEVDYEVQDVAYDDGDNEVLVRIGDVENAPESHQAWVLFVDDGPGSSGIGAIVNGSDFDDLVLRAGTSYQLAFLQDQDEDKLFAREEYLHGSRDDALNSDNAIDDDSFECSQDGYAFDYFQLAENAGATLPLERPRYTCDTLSDFAEVREGWLVAVRGETAYRAYPSPRLTDSDGDGLVDHIERELGTDPMKRDSDADAFSDFDEIYGFSMRFRGDFTFSDVTLKFCPAMIAGESCAAGEVELFVTDPLDPDTDGDGILDGYEPAVGANPQFADAADFVDTDRDGLSDSLEDEFGSSKYEPDTDGDGLPDLLEQLIGSDPRSAQGDGDGLSDYQEVDINTVDNLPGVDFNLDSFLTRCGSVTYGATACSYSAPTAPGLPYGTHPARDDTDDDGLDDDVELETSWTVTPYGQSGYSVSPDPANADLDSDGLDDAEEMLAGTDPDNANTDGDGSLDGADSFPLRGNVGVTFQYTSITVDGDCDDGSGGTTDWQGVLRLHYPDGTVSTVWNLERPDDGGDGIIDNVDEGATVNLTGLRPRSFTLLDGQSFTASSSVIEDWDGGSGNENLGSFSQTFNYGSSIGGSYSKSLNGGDMCGLTINWSIVLN